MNFMGQHLEVSGVGAVGIYGAGVMTGNAVVHIPASTTVESQLGVTTIAGGVRTMPGYGSQISVEDRWAVVLYLKALQRSQAATLDDVPADQRQRLR